MDDDAVWSKQRSKYVYAINDAGLAPMVGLFWYLLMRYWSFVKMPLNIWNIFAN